MRYVIQEIFQKHFEAYRLSHNLPLHVIKAVRAICKCRTAELGGHVLKCPDGHVEQVWYNSCKHRFCPICSFVEIGRWIHKQVNRLPDCDYYHTIFTLPWELNRVWEFNRKVFTKLLFKAAWECLKELLADPKYLGALPGAIASFHSWTQTIWIHPHVHFLVTGGGMTSDGKWVNSRNDFLLPARVVSAKFRGKFLAFLRQALQTKKLVPPDDMSEQQLLNLLNKLGRKKWHVMIMPPYRHGKGVIKYLGRYVRGGPISKSRVTIETEDTIRLRCKNEDRTGHNFVRLSMAEFISRMVRHVPLEGVHLTRCYGLLDRRARAQLNAARSLLGQLPVADDDSLTWQAVCAQAGNIRTDVCPICGKRLLEVELSRSSGLSPPSCKLAS
jgi:hypothetical protein